MQKDYLTIMNIHTRVNDGYHFFSYASFCSLILYFQALWSSLKILLDLLVDQLVGYRWSTSCSISRYYFLAPPKDLSHQHRSVSHIEWPKILKWNCSICLAAIVWEKREVIYLDNKRLIEQQRNILRQPTTLIQITTGPIWSVYMWVNADWG